MDPIALKLPDAVIVAVPGATPVTRVSGPEVALMLATLGSLVAQVGVSKL